MNPVGSRSNELLEYLVQTCPDLIEKKSGHGNTPLMMACMLGRLDFIKILLDANADQSTRNLNGENIIHMGLKSVPRARQLRRFLDLLDPDLRTHLFTQRKHLQDSGATPVHTWIEQTSVSTMEAVETLKLLLEYSKGDELEMLNGAGDAPLHTAIVDSDLGCVKTLLDFKPELLYRENAVGRTPAEIAHDLVTGQTFTRPGSMSISQRNQLEQLPHKSPDDFVESDSFKDKAPETLSARIQELGLSDSYSSKQLTEIVGSMGMKDSPDAMLNNEGCERVIWDLCRTTMERHPSKRRLVSLNEANDVAKRLGEQYTGSRYFSMQPRRDEDDAEEEDAKSDDEDQERCSFADDQLSSRTHDAWEVPKNDMAGLVECEVCGERHD